MRRELRNKSHTVPKMHTQFMMKRRTTLILFQSLSNTTEILNPTLPLTIARFLDHITRVSNQETSRQTSSFEMDLRSKRSFIV